MAPANLSNTKGISFWAKGDGKTYTLVVLTQARSGQNGMPAMTQFAAGPDWKEYSFPFTMFETDGGDLSGLAFVATQQTGKFEFQIDQVVFGFQLQPWTRGSTWSKGLCRCGVGWSPLSIGRRSERAVGR